jgi:hypothetical protein
MRQISFEKKTLQLAKVTHRLYKDFIQNGLCYSQQRLITLNARAERINNYARGLIEFKTAQQN